MLTPAPLLARLPAPLQRRLRDLGTGAHDLFGALTGTQAIFDANVALFDALIDGGADHGLLARLLAEVGIVRPDGRPLPRGTVSSALCRARERPAAAGAPTVARPRPAAGRSRRHPPAAAASGSVSQRDADDSSSLQRAAALSSNTQQGAPRRRRSRRAGAAGGGTARDPAFAGPDVTSGGDITPSAIGRPASLLLQLRTRHHGTETE